LDRPFPDICMYEFLFALMWKTRFRRWSKYFRYRLYVARVWV
jgi:hypothetical protein